ncbi:MAG: acyl-CoA dehydrogenase family protein [Frankia sp.]|nr:acyl-CoA dehydrogenase family protein [Frankia sp.]
MQWSLSEEQSAYRQALRDWLGDVAPTEAVRGWLDAADHTTFTKRFVADGFWGVGVAEDLGGQGGGLVELALTAEELGRHAAPSASWLATLLAVPALAAAPAARAEVLAGAGAALLVAAESIVPGPVPVTVDDAGRVSGTVPRVLAGGEARFLVVPARGAAGMTLRLVEATDPGVRLARRELLDRSRSVADVVLSDAASEPLAVAAGEVLAQAANRAAVLVAADSLGATERMLELAVAYSGQRRQFGVPIGSFQAVKHAAATIMVGVEAARSVIYLAAASVHGGDPRAVLHAAAAKAQVTAEGARAADTALTLHGAIGYTWEHDLHLFYKRAKLDEWLFGSPTAWNEVLADALALA